MTNNAYIVYWSELLTLYKETKHSRLDRGGGAKKKQTPHFKDIRNLGF